MDRSSVSKHVTAPAPQGLPLAVSAPNRSRWFIIAQMWKSSQEVSSRRLP